MSATKSSERRLIVNADDFGRSESINAAVIQAHQRGILTTASLMVNEPAWEGAVELARANPRLGVGLHLSLLCGRSALSPQEIPGLVDANGRFSDNPAGVGFRYFFVRSLREQLAREIRAQFERFRSTGLTLDHVDGHLHLHLHPVIFPLMLETTGEFCVRHVRLTRDCFRLNARLAGRHWGYRVSHAIVFGALSRRALPALRRAGLRHTDRVYGLLQDGRIDSNYILSLLPHLQSGVSELYSHPSLDEFKNEFEALTDPRVGERLKTLGIQLIRYQDF